MQIVLVNNKRGGVDTFMESLFEGDLVYILVNKSHVKNITLERYHPNSKVQVWILIFLFPFG